MSSSSAPDSHRCPRRVCGDLARSAIALLAGAVLTACVGSDPFYPGPARDDRYYARRDAERAHQLNRRARERYAAADLDGARADWFAALELDPGNEEARLFLGETQPEWDEVLAARDAEKAQEETGRRAAELLGAPVSITTDRPAPLSEFMRMLSLAAPEELQYSIAADTEATVTASFRDRPIQEVLTFVLDPLGMTWFMDEGGVIRVEDLLEARAIALDGPTYLRVQDLLDQGELQRLVWGSPDPPTRDSSLDLDFSSKSLLFVGSRQHARRLEEFLATLSLLEPSGGLETRAYKIRPEDGQKIKALLNGILGAEDSASAVDPPSRVFTDGSDLILRASREDIEKAEELLLGKDLIGDPPGSDLTLMNFSLVPRGFEAPDSEQTRTFTARVVEAVETLLYASEGRSAAEREGRRLWFDSATLQLTVVDTHERIAMVADYLDTLPELRSGRNSKVIPLEYGRAEDIAEAAGDALGPDVRVRGGTAGDEIMPRLDRGDEIEFRGLRVRLMRVEENNVNDRRDDEAELLLTLGRDISNINLRELDRTIFNDYELTAEEIRPSAGQRSGGRNPNPGDGTATIRIRYLKP